jgi:hypothetical protein
MDGFLRRLRIGEVIIDKAEVAATIAVVAIALQASACDTTSYRAAREELVVIDLVASRRNTGETGKAFLLPRGEATQVRIDVSGSAVPVAVPAQLYMFIYEGRCGSLSAQPKYSLTQVVQASSALNPASLGSGPGPWMLSNPVPAPLAVLRGTPHALVVRTSPADANVDLFCGNL